MRRVTSSYYTYYYQKYRGLMWRQVTECTPHPNLREEMAMMACKEVLYALIHFDRDRNKNLMTYLMSRLRGRLYHYLRDEMRHIRRLLPYDSLDTTAVRSENPVLRLIVEEVLAVLNQFEQMVIVSTMRDGKSVRAVGEELGVSHDTVWRTQKIALAKIHTRFPDAEAVVP